MAGLPSLPLVLAIGLVGVALWTYAETHARNTGEYVIGSLVGGMAVGYALMSLVTRLVLLAY